MEKLSGWGQVADFTFPNGGQEALTWGTGVILRTILPPT